MTKEIQKWADKAMFEAEPMESTTPKVYLLSMSGDPLGEIASAAKMYKGEVVRSLSEVTDAERMGYFDDLTKTALNAAFETVKFHFLLEGVPRSFTHQLVRQRTAVYFQESMRFAVIDESFKDRVATPHSLRYTDGDQARGAESSNDEWMRNVWDDSINHVEEAYKHLVHAGMPAEEARGLLPTDVLTRVHYVTDLRNLVGHAGLRLCTQAQFVWRTVFSQIARSIREAKMVIPGRPHIDIPVHMASQISDRLFRPICYSTGKCEFMASFDRPCSIRDRVQQNHEIGRPSSEWSQVGHTASPAAGIKPIFPAEWLLDDSAARS